jgi:hypothetical protein
VNFDLGREALETALSGHFLLFASGLPHCSNA